MTNIVIRKLNDTWMSVKCEEKSMEMEIAERFSFQVKNAKYDPRVKSGKWDGVKRLYNRTHKRMHVGLLFELIKFLNKQGYTYNVDKTLAVGGDVTHEDIHAIVLDVIKPHDKRAVIEPYDYQYECVHWMLNAGRSISLAATSAGKSLCIYIAVRTYQLLDEFEDKAIIVIVPSKMLVEQLYADFDNYSTHDEQNWFVDTHCQKVNGDYTKTINRQIIITTWQSLKDLPAHVVANAGAIFVDEVHTVAGPILTKLLEAAVSCPIRHGLTGTLDGFECNELAAQGLLGPAKKIVSAKELIDEGRATKVNVNVVILDYDNRTKRMYAEDQANVPKTRAALKYNSEVNFINNLQCRFDFIQQTVQQLKGNTIVLFDRVEDYGIPLYEDMKSKKTNTFLISGDVKTEDRETIKTMLENINDGVVYATTSIMSTGVSIKNLHNMIFVSSSKARIRVLQSLGRLMRLHESKQSANLIDIVDKLDYNGKANFVLNHVEERIKFYSSEKHKVSFVSMKLIEPEKDAVTLEI